jgi:hypothetical protein
MRARGRSRRPSTTARRSRAWTSTSPTSALNRKSLAAALENNATLTNLRLVGNNIGDQGARALVAALDTKRILQQLNLFINNINADIEDMVADRLGVNKLDRRVPAWVAYAVVRLTEVPGHLGKPPFLAECAAVLALGDELLVLPDDNYKWRTPGGRDLAAAYLLPLAEAALRPRCSDWPARLVPVPGQRSIASIAAC